MKCAVQLVSVVHPPTQRLVLVRGGESRSQKCFSHLEHEEENGVQRCAVPNPDKDFHRGL